MKKNIVLLCANGMSTSLLVTKMRKVAAKSGYECDINAYSVTEASERGAVADAILIGPQASYELNNVKKACPDRKIEVIDMMTYGMMDGKKALDQAKKMIGD